MLPHRRLVVMMTAASLLLVPDAGAAATLGPKAEETDLAVRDSSTSYRIPAITVTPNGTVIAAYDRRPPDAPDLPADIDTMVRRSTDNGQTWQNEQIAADYPGPQGCGDPSLLTDQKTGKVFLFCTFSHGEVGFRDSEPGSADADDPRTQHVRVMTSEDDGATWSKPVDLTAQVKDAAWHGMFASSGHGIQLDDGRLLQPIVVRDADGKYRSGSVYSDDHGATWKHGELADEGTDENKDVQVADGTVDKNSRSEHGGMRLLSSSDDGGVSFGAAKETTELPDPGVNADQIRVDPDQNSERREHMLFINPAHRSERENLTIRLSCDSGTSWPNAMTVHSGPAAYSAMAMLPDGKVGVLAENGASEDIEKLTFTRLDLSEIGTC